MASSKTIFEIEAYILSIDMGTTSMKAAVFDQKGNNLVSSVVEYTLLTPDTNMVEVPCEVYMHSIKKCMEIISEQKLVDMQQIMVIGFSVQGETICTLDKDGKPLKNAIVWMDNRAGKQAETLRNYFGDELCYQVTGQVSFEACWPAAKILWIRENEPEVFKKIKHILLLEDYIIYQLTGQFVTEGSLLTSTEYWDIRTKSYWKEMLDFLGIEMEQLPNILEPGEIVGTILPDMAEWLGVSKNAKVCTGCLDQAAAAIGVGNIHNGMLSENIGAALAICVPVSELKYDPHRQMPVHYFGIPDTYMMHSFTTGGMCFRWFRDNFCSAELHVQEMTELDAYDLMDREAELVDPGSNGLITLPHLQGSMAPDVNLDAKCVFYGATLKHKKAHFIRSIMESLGYIICRNLETVEKMGLDIGEIRTMGGGSKSDLWNQIKADIIGKPLYLTSASQDVACLGAAIIAGRAAGFFDSIDSAVKSMVHVRKVYEPNMENHEVYLKQYKKYKALFEMLTPLFKMDSGKE